jgi:hypothetical protein
LTKEVSMRWLYGSARMTQGVEGSQRAWPSVAAAFSLADDPEPTEEHAEDAGLHPRQAKPNRPEGRPWRLRRGPDCFMVGRHSGGVLRGLASLHGSLILGGAGSGRLLPMFGTCPRPCRCPCRSASQWLEEGCPAR